MQRGREVYEACMLIGNRFNQKYLNEETHDWHGSEECATVARLTYELMSTINISMEQALDIVMENIIENGFRNIEDHAWDFYVRGFLAGQILGIPTQENIKKAEKADTLWDNDDGCKYGYYQEVLEEVK